VEEAQALIQEATTQLELAGEKGIKLTFHTGKKQSAQGREFDSTFFFCQAVQERTAGGGAPSGAAPKKFVPRVPKTLA
jgi:hypothetical protein